MKTAVEAIEKRIAEATKYLNKTTEKINSMSLNEKDTILRMNYETNKAYIAGLRFALTAIRVEEGEKV